MSEQSDNRPDPGRVERVDGAVAVVTPCCGVQVQFPPDKAVPDVVLHAVCPEDGQGWLLHLMADAGAESGLRLVWTPFAEGEAGR
ncbi:MAG: hypothetical protein ACRD0K_10400 [Egibacteraceae bacterium]